MPSLLDAFRRFAPPPVHTTSPATGTPGTAPGPYHTTTTPRSVPSLGAPPRIATGGSNLEQTSRIRSILGPDVLNLYFPWEGEIRQGDIPGAQLRAEEMVRQQVEQDRERAYEEYSRGRGAVGASPSATLAREIAVQRTQSPGPGGVIRGSGGVAAEDLRRGVAQDFAARGIGGGVPGFAMADLERKLAADVAERAAMADATYEGETLRDLLAITAREDEARRIYDMAIADLFASTERTVPDFSALVANVPSHRQLIGT